MRFLDISFSLIGLLLLSPLFFLIFILGYFDTGSPLFTQKSRIEPKEFYSCEIQNYENKHFI